MRKSQVVGALGIGVLAVSLTAGCSGSEGGTAVPGGASSSSSAPSSAPVSSSGTSADEEAPSVSDPLDTAGLDQDPCSALTAEQVKSFGVNSGEKRQSGEDTVCTYKYGDMGGSRISVTPMKSFSNGLSTVYWQKNDLAYFEPTEVSGYPGVYAGKFKDDRGRGYCGLYVALNDERTVWFDVQLEDSSRDYPKGCEVGEVVAEKMIENLKGGA